MKVCIISLGCPKNLIDSEVAAGGLVDGGLDLVFAPEDADAVVINTCGFVESAKAESLDTIEEMIRYKKKGMVSSVVVIGCLSQRYQNELKQEMPEVDAFLPITDYSELPKVLKGEKKGRGGKPRTTATDAGRLLLTRPHVSYLRIAEGCNHRCSYCVIPDIRGPLKSKPLETVVREAEDLAFLGVKEINLVAEDTTDYGRDLKKQSLLPKLLQRLGRIEDIKWVRLLYAYPSRITQALVRVMAETKNVVPYLDMPIQHISPRILKSMGRGVTSNKIQGAIDLVRERIRHVAIRTSLIVGYPGETDQEFEALHDFVKNVRFERLGAFAFSPEEGTKAAAMENQVPEEVVMERMERIMLLQKSIIESRNQSLVGQFMEVMVDGPDTGRTWADAPQIDCLVKLQSKRELNHGDLVRVKITGYDGYDLIGAMAEPD